MTPTYQIKAWQEDDWWLARVVDASETADRAPLNAITQARNLAKIESMGRDLIATILDADEDTFDVEVDYALPSRASDVVAQAKGARAWLDASQSLWQERSTTAARALAEQGYSLRETAALLGMSHQRVDQLLEDRAGQSAAEVLIYECAAAGQTTRTTKREAVGLDVNALLLIRLAASSERLADQRLEEDLRAEFSGHFVTLVSEMELRFAEYVGAVDRDDPART
jgi:transcriptional regulator with XRE-family HTH domain